MRYCNADRRRVTLWDICSGWTASWARFSLKFTPNAFLMEYVAVAPPMDTMTSHLNNDWGYEFPPVINNLNRSSIYLQYLLLHLTGEGRCMRSFSWRKSLEMVKRFINSSMCEEYLLRYIYIVKPLNQHESSYAKSFLTPPTQTVLLFISSYQIKIQK